MDDIQFWLYVAFGLIYFVTRFFKKKKSDDEFQESSPENQGQPRRRPKTFEELLREFSEEQNEEKREEVLDDYAEEQLKKTEPARIEPIEPIQSKRQFADDESRRVYEESIKMAEGADLKFERNDHFKSGITRRSDAEEETSSFGNEILESLRDKDSAKKAVVLSEILNRRY